MPVPTCNLRTHRPTPTTVSYTVSTRAPLRTLTARLIHYLALFSRILIASCLLVLLWAKWRATYLQRFLQWIAVEDALRDSALGRAFLGFAKGLNAVYLVPAALMGLYACSWRGYTGEFSRSSPEIDPQTNTYTTRGITARTPRAGNPDHKLVGYVSIHKFNAIYSDHFDPGYLHS